jgi:hypothetical protein
MRLKPVENTLVQSFLLELEQAFPLGRAIQEHVFEIPESAAPAS